MTHDIFFANQVPELLAVSICPDYVVYRGHYFGTIFLPEELPLRDTEKRGLLEFTKTYERDLAATNVITSGLERILRWRAFN